MLTTAWLWVMTCMWHPTMNASLWVALLDASGEALFTKKAVIIPSNVYFVLTNAIKRGTKAFKEGDETPFEILLYKYSKVHHVVAKFEKWENDLEDGEFKFKIQIKWNFKADRSFNRLVEMGLKDAIDTSNIPGDWVWLRGHSKTMWTQFHSFLTTHLPPWTLFMY